jgi:hypothetical protein
MLLVLLMRAPLAQASAPSARIGNAGDGGTRGKASPQAVHRVMPSPAGTSWTWISLSLSFGAGIAARAWNIGSLK